MNEPDFKEFFEKYCKIQSGSVPLDASERVAKMMEEARKSGGKPIRFRYIGRCSYFTPALMKVYFSAPPPLVVQEAHHE